LGDAGDFCACSLDHLYPNPVSPLGLVRHRAPAYDNLFEFVKVNYTGVIIEESLADKVVLGRVKILSTKISPVTEKDGTPWLKQWTLHTVEVAEGMARSIAKQVSHTLEAEHEWYADFKNATHHYIIFRDKIFYIDRTNSEQYREATQHGITLGLPPHQVDFSKEVVRV
jgi:hypothetical protein